MDPARREKLEKRRKAMNARQAERDHRVARGHIIPQLRAAGVPHRMVKRGELPIWLPRYLPTTFIRIYWEGAPDPAEWEYCETLAERIGTIERMLREQAAPDDVLLFAYDFHGDNVMIRQADALPALSILCAPDFTIWITSPPKDWLIESDSYIVRLALPPPVSPEETARINARRAALLAPLVEALTAARASHEIHLPSDLTAPDLPAAVAPDRRIDWQRVKRTFHAAVPRRNVPALAKEIGTFLPARCTGETPLAVRLLHPDAPIVTLSVEDFVRFIGPVMSAADRWDEEAPGGLIDITGVLFYPVDGDWLAQIYPERANWRIRVAG